MNSTKPITSAEGGPLTALPLAFIALAAVAVIGVSLRDAWGAVSRSNGIAAATEAAALPIGAERDRQLEEAQGALIDALQIRPDDEALWSALAQTRWLQATGAEVRTVSQPLVSAALFAARRAAELAPEKALAHARVAQLLSLKTGADVRAAAESLAHSYRLAALDEHAAAVRVDTAGRIWPSLSATAQRDAMAEACIVRRTGAAIAPVFADVTRNAACAPIAGPDSSPPAP